MLELIFETFLIYGLLLVIIRLMGKREITQLSPFDFVVAIMIADLAVAPLDQETPFKEAIVPLAVLVILEVGLSYLSLHSLKLRKILNGKPQIVICNGLVLKSELKKARYNLNDLLAQLREKGYPNIGDVEMGVLETSGKLTVVPKSQKRPVVPSDLSLSTPYEGLPVILIMDGVVIEDELKRNNLDRVWLENELAKRNLITSEVFFATLNTEGDFYVVRGDEKINLRGIK